MKQIGTTGDGNHIITMTGDEFKAFQLLQEVARGKIVEFPYPQDVQLDTDMHDALNAIRMWIESMNTVNKMQAGVDRVRETLGIPCMPTCTCVQENEECCESCSHA